LHDDYLDRAYFKKLVEFPKTERDESLYSLVPITKDAAISNVLQSGPPIGFTRNCMLATGNDAKSGGKESRKFITTVSCKYISEENIEFEFKELYGTNEFKDKPEEFQIVSDLQGTGGYMYFLTESAFHLMRFGM